jgi:hypothetical protein
VAACRSGCDTPGHRCHREFFSAALELDNHSLGVTENAPDGGNGHKARKSIEVEEQLEFCHRNSMTSFSSKGKTIYSENCGVSGAPQAESYPLKNAKSHIFKVDDLESRIYSNYAIVGILHIVRAEPLSTTAPG